MENIIEIPRQGKGPSKIVVGDVISKLDAFLPDRRIIVITDASVDRLYSDIVRRYEHIVIGMGETIKTLSTIDSIYRRLIEMDADRHCFILGFGGGIVTDIAGFVASTWMRGVDFGFVATTLLSQVDASVGGKNGVNVEGYKNMIGVFNQPDFVLCDMTLLSTLPEREFRAGLAEILKAGVIADTGLFGMFESHTADDFRRDNQLLAKVVLAAIRVKAAIVADDEHEHGVRRKLNLGHTFAHAIEKCSDKYLHGEAVAAGLAMIVSASTTLGMLAPQNAHRILEAIRKQGLPTETEVNMKRLLKALQHDKKSDGDRINLVLINDIGDCGIRKTPWPELESMFG